MVTRKAKMYRECRSRSGSDPQDVNEQEELGKALCSHLNLFVLLLWGKKNSSDLAFCCDFNLILWEFLFSHLSKNILCVHARPLQRPWSWSYRPLWNAWCWVLEMELESPERLASAPNFWAISWAPAGNPSSWKLLVLMRCKTWEAFLQAHSTWRKILLNLPLIVDNISYTGYNWLGVNAFKNMPGCHNHAHDRVFLCSLPRPWASVYFFKLPG